MKTFINLRLAACAALLLFCPLAAEAQLTLEECQQKARSNYPEVAQYDLVAQTAEYNVANASRGWIPQVTLSGQATWQSAVASFPDQLTQMLAMQGVDLPGIAQDQYRVALDVNQTLWDGGASRANRRMAEARAAEQRLTSDVSIYALEQRVNDLFFGILLLDESYAISRERSLLLDENYQRLQSLKRNGAALQSDLDLVRVEQLTLDQQMLQNRASRASYAAMLAMFIGQPVDSLSMPDDEVALKPASAERPEVQLIDARIATVEAQQALMQSQLMPRLSFFAQGFYGNPGLDMFQAMTSRDWTWNAYLGLRLQWNISALFTHKSDAGQLATQRKALDVQRETFVFNNKMQRDRQAAEVERMRQAQQKDDEIVALRSSIRRTAESQRENGVIDTPTLLQRMAEESAALTTRSIHRIEMLKTLYELRHTEGH